MNGKDRAGVIAPPPLIYVAFFLAGWMFRHALPRWGSPPIGWALIAIGLISISRGAMEMFRARTHIDVYKPTKTLVTTGPFRFSRNPLYVSLTLLYAGAALAMGLTAALALLPLVLGIVHFGVIRREERYLEEKFGEAYRAYCQRVRRWI